MASRPELGANFLFRWAIQATVAGALAAALVRAFDVALTFLSTYTVLRAVHPLVGAAGAAIVAGLFLYRLAPGAAGEGIPAYLDAIRDRDGTLPFRDTIVKFPAAVITLAFWGSGGLVGPLGRVVSGLSQTVTFGLQRLFPRFFADHELHSDHYHAPTTAAISGMAAAVAAIFHAPIAGAVFAVEIIQSDQLRYHQLFPAILSSAATVFFMNHMGWSAPITAVVTAHDPKALAIIPILLVGLFSGFIGRFYTALYRTMAVRVGRYRRQRSTIRLLAGMLIAASLTLLVHPAIGGTSSSMMRMVSFGDVDALKIAWLPWGGPILLLVLLFVKMVSNCVTVASGMSAGFTGPAALVGMMAGAAVALLFGYETGGHTYTSLVVAGFAGTLASTMNIPLAAAILAMEVFSPAFGVPAGVAAILGFQTARYNTIYDTALETRRGAVSDSDSDQADGAG
ncbi:MAG: chloride channel protein [Spirochaeta sp.]|nr:chloride channel protein [Spirochaeta sp.]